MKSFLLISTFFLSFFSFGNCPPPTICNRACWDPDGTHPAQSNPSTTNPTHIIVHHTGDGVVFPNGTDYAEKVRFYWDLHVNTNGWSDIGYNYLIDRNGVIYEGRGDGVTGAHFSCMSSRTTGICMIGDFTMENPSQAALDALRDLIAWEAGDKNIDVAATTLHTTSDLFLNGISGHQDGNTSPSPNSCASGTVCPGTNLYSQLSYIINSVATLPCYDVNSNLDCANAVPLSCGVTYSGSSSNATSSISTYGCNNWTEIGPERVHTFTPTENGEITATISNYSGDLDVYILGSCDPSDCLGTVASSSATFSNAVAGTTYYIVVDSDDGSGSAYDIVMTCPTMISVEDVTVTNVSTTSSLPILAGATIDISAEQNYTGTLSTLPDVYLNYYLSEDCALDSSDVLLEDNVFSQLNQSNPTSLEVMTLTIPEFTFAGDYYIVLVSDATNQVAEDNENNNLGCLQISVSSNLPTGEITLSNAEITSQTSIYPGEDIDVEVTQNYDGQEQNIPDVFLYYYLSEDCILDSSDLLLMDTEFSTINANDPSDGESETLTIPAVTTHGSYYILFDGDATNVVNETNEIDNLSCVELEILEDLSLSQLEKTGLKVFPNPTDGKLNVVSENELIDQIDIIDFTGKVVHQSQKGQLDISNLPKGVYIVRVHFENQSMQSIHIVLQ